MKKGLFQVLVANIISLLISVFTSFFIPKYLSVDSYALYKTYSLYISYAGFFHLGYADGMYLKYGGKKIEDINKKDLADNFKNFLYLIFLMGILVFIFGNISSDNILTAFAFGMVSSDILDYLRSLYQATGEFGAYGKALNFEKIGVFILTLILLFIVHTDNYLLYIIVQIFVGAVIAIYLIAHLEHKLHFLKLGKFSAEEYKENISSGFVLMLGNFSSSLFIGLDRWFVKFLMHNLEFALYSFASSLLSLMNVFITPITVTLYNYFCKDIDDLQVRKLKQLVLAWGLLLIAAEYPVKFVLDVYLKKYIGADQVVFILFSAQAFIAVIQGIFVNLYKAKKKQKEYFFEMLVMLMIGVVTNAGFYMVKKSMVSFAWATLFTYFAWFIICEVKNPGIRCGLNEYITIIVLIFLAIITGSKLNPVAGLLVYLSVYFILIKFLMPDVMRFIKTNTKNGLTKLKGYIKAGH